MTVRYHTRRGVESPDYYCGRDSIQSGGPGCQYVPGATIDTAIADLLLATVSPLALEVALTVQTELETRAAQADTLRRQHVERARHHADLARRRYLAVDPDNRLVADTLEADWNNALRAVQAAQHDYDQAVAAQGALTDEHRARIRALATDFPALWKNPATPQRERKRMARLLIDDVTINKTTENVHLQVRFRGGQTTSLTIPVPLSAWRAKRTPTDTIALLDQLLDQHTDSAAADELNIAGNQSGSGKPFNATIVVHIRQKYQLPSHAKRLRAQGMRTVTEIAEQLGVHPDTVKAWGRAGLLVSHKANDKNERLYQPPNPGDPNLLGHRGNRLHNRVSTPPTPGGAV
jgi:hypothetical protein